MCNGRVAGAFVGLPMLVLRVAFGARWMRILVDVIGVTAFAFSLLWSFDVARHGEHRRSAHARLCGVGWMAVVNHTLALLVVRGVKVIYPVHSHLTASAIRVRSAQSSPTMVHGTGNIVVPLRGYLCPLCFLNLLRDE